MKNLALFALAVASAAIFSLALPQESSAGNPCVTKDFKTELIKQACEKGGQAGAITAMKHFDVDRHVSSCTLCHSKLLPDYPLKADGLETFKKLGGK